MATARMSGRHDRPRWAVGALAVAVAMVLGTVWLPAAQAATGTPIVGVPSGRCLDVSGNNSAAGTPVQLWDCNGQANQAWHATSSGELRTFDDSMCLDATGRGTSPGTTLEIWTCNGGSNQKFHVNGDGTITGEQSGLCVDANGRDTANGTPVILWTCNGQSNQQWRTTTGTAPTAGPTSDPTTPPASYPDPGYVTGDTGVHDPSVVKTSGGYLLAYTGTNVGLKTSTDRTAWRNVGSAFPGGAPWTYPYTNGSHSLWAPDISYHNGQFYMYYAASTFGSNHSAIFLATSTTGASGSWTNRGLVIASQSSDNFNAIDPNLFVDEQGRWWLAFGSFWSGIKLIRIDSSTGLRADTAMHSIASRGGGAIEASFLFSRGGYYYLYVSFDLCCRGADSTYRIMVGRSTSVTGPYLDRNGTPMMSGGGTQVLAGHGGIHGPGGEGVFSDADADVLVYHWYADSGASYLGINLIGYDAAGWPFVY